MKPRQLAAKNSHQAEWPLQQAASRSSIQQRVADSPTSAFTSPVAARQSVRRNSHVSLSWQQRKRPFSRHRPRDELSEAPVGSVQAVATNFRERTRGSRVPCWRPSARSWRQFEELTANWDTAGAVRRMLISADVNRSQKPNGVARKGQFH